MKKYKIYAKDYDEGVDDQLNELIKNTPFSESSHIRIMPDTHVGKGCVIGFSSKLEDFVIPNVIGVDIGCGMLVVPLGKIDINLRDLDIVIKFTIPHGLGKVNKTPLSDHILKKLTNIKAPLKNEEQRIERSLGSLGGGNHFIELNENDKGEKYLVIHSGSRNLGCQIANYWQEKAYDNQLITQKTKKSTLEIMISDLFMNNYKDAGEYIKTKYLFKLEKPIKDFAWLTGQDKKNYINDMKIAQEFASRNRFWMAFTILESLSIDTKLLKTSWETCHNFIDFKDNIVRKGSARAHKGENVIVPINMRDGSILGIGKGNENWNNSAPHGAGRVLSRKQAHATLDFNDVKKQMENVYTTTLTEKTKDEAPDAYNSIEYIKSTIIDSVEIKEIIRPIYNFKGSK